MVLHSRISKTQLYLGIRTEQIQLAGNSRLKIYGTLDCKSGKRMKKVNRVFFTKETEALMQGFRPCGHCMRPQYLLWQKLFC